MVKRVSYLLRGFGIGAEGPGRDVVFTISSGNPFIPLVFYSIIAAGGVFSGASTAARLSEIVHQIKGTHASVLIVSPDFEEITVEAAKHCGIPLERVLILDSKTPGKWALRSARQRRVLSLDKKLDWQRINEKERLQDTTIAIIYSSGTTGLPKGVRLSQWSIVASCICTMDPARRYKARHKDFAFNTISHLPMASIAGIDLYSINPFYMGGTTYWMEKYTFDSFIEYHRQYRPAYQFSVPPIWLQIAKSSKVTDHFDALQVAVTGSAPIGWSAAKEVRAKIGKGNALFTQTWGATECAGVITAFEWRHAIDEESWSVGDLCPNVRLRIVDNNNQDVDSDSGQAGEMLVGGDILAQEYHNNPAATHEAFEGAFYRTGDIGVYRNGSIRIVDRKKELIKYKGNQVAPAELEAVLTSHPKIADAAVIGIWDEQQETELPLAFVVKQPAASLTDREVADFVKGNLASYKQLRGGVSFLDQIPKSASGKILRKDLRMRATKSKERIRASL